jgi:hypothetical protein
LVELLVELLVEESLPSAEGDLEPVSVISTVRARCPVK